MNAASITLFAFVIFGLVVIALPLSYVIMHLFPWMFPVIVVAVFMGIVGLVVLSKGESNG